MIEQLEADLREALASRASEVPDDASARLRRIDYGPRAHRVRPPVAVGALVGAAGTAAVVASLVGLGAGASSAFAGWTASPTLASNDQTAKADASCAARIAAMPTHLHAADAKPVLTDTRGPFTVVIFAGANGNQSCIDGPSFTSLTENGMGAHGKVSVGSVSGAGRGSGSLSVSGGAGSATPPAGDVALSLLATTAHGGSQFTIVEGHTGAGVTGATLVLADGSRVTASTANGWFAAWWPGAVKATGVDVATPSGVTTQHLTTGGPVLCGPGSCTRPITDGSTTTATATATAGASGHSTTTTASGHSTTTTGP